MYLTKKIVLIRHAKVKMSKLKRIPASEFAQWVDSYNNANIKENFSFESDLDKVLNASDIIITSTLKRTIDTAQLFKSSIYESNVLFDEAQLPLPNWKFLKFTPFVWLVILRLLWFFGYSKKAESLKQTRQRAKIAAEYLNNLSKKHNTVTLIGHGIMNKLIKKQLLLLNWQESKKLCNKNLGYGELSFME